jgi:hypothetical protein
MLLSGAEALLSGADGAAELASSDAEPELLPPHAAVMVSADTTAVAAAILFMVRMVLSLSIGVRRDCLCVQGIRRLTGGGLVRSRESQLAVTLTLCQPVEPLGAMGVRLSVWT